MSKLKVQSLKVTYARAIKHITLNRDIKIAACELKESDHLLASIMRDDRSIALRQYMIDHNTNVSGRKI